MKISPHLSFEGGGLSLELEGFPEPGAGHFAFTEDDLLPLTEWDDETGACWDGFLVKLPASELAAIRDFLNEWLPADQSASEGSDAAQVDRESSRDEPLPPPSTSQGEGA